MLGPTPALDAYLPAGLARRLAATDPTRTGHTVATVEGVATLFVDIRGYTDLTERLCRAGPEGVERLKRLISRAFSRYIETIYAYGGEVALFAGDAILAYWDDDGSTPRERLDRAVTCADSLRKVTSAPDHDRAYTPELRIGVGLGAMWVAAVGPSQTPELILGGAAVVDAMRAKRDASPGEIVAPSDLVRTHLDDVGSPSTSGRHRVITPRRRPDPHHPAATSLDGATRARFEHLIHPAVRATLADEASGGEHWLAERRNVMPLFAQFDVGDLSERGEPGEHGGSLPGGTAERAHELMLALRAAAAPTIGTGGRLLVDDNGLVFLHVFGTPNTTRGNELERALSLAWDLRAASRSLGIDCAVGIAGGEAFCGALGTPQRREYVTIGRPMNLAARLMVGASASSEILLDAQIANRVEGWQLETLPPRSFKGIQEPISPARLDGRATAHRQRALVGRDHELRALEGAMNDRPARDGVVVLIGQAGLGKSVLLDTLSAQAREQGKRVVFGGAGVPDAAAAYAAIRPLLCATFGLDTQAPPKVLEAAVAERLAADDDRNELGSLLNGALGIALPETAVTRGFRGQDRAEATLRLLTALVGERMEGEPAHPTWITIEDLHWVDSASIRLFAQLLRATEHVRILATSRPTPTSQQSGLLSVMPIATTVALRPLDVQDVAALLSNELEGSLDDDELVSIIYERTAGNPLFCREYALTLLERDALETGPRGLRRRRGTNVLADLPEGVQALISSRIDRLTPAAQRALKTSAVLGRVFSLALLASVIDDVAVGDLESTLESLASHRLVQREAGDEWIFDHASIRDTAYDLLLFEQRANLHRRAAEVLSAPDPDHAFDVRAVDLVRHWEGAGDDAMTLQWSDRAADEAIDAGAWREAVDLLGGCLRLTGTRADEETKLRRVRWMRKLSEAHGQLGHNGERRQYAHDALELAGIGETSRRLGARLRSGVEVSRLVRTYAFAPGRAGRNLGEPGPRDPMHVEFARAHSQAATVAYFDGDGIKLLTETLAAIDHAESAGLPGDLVRRYAELGGALGIAGLTGLAERHIDQASDMARKTSDLAALVYANMVRALYSVGRADFDKVERAVDEGQALAQRLQLWNDWGNIQIIRAWMYLYRGEYDHLRDAAQDLHARSLKIANEQHESWALRALGMYQLHTGEPELAVDLLRRASVGPERDQTTAELFECTGSLALALARAGDVPGALEQARRSIDLAERVGNPTVHVQSIAASSLSKLVVERVTVATDGEAAEAWRALGPAALGYLKKCARTFPVARPHYEQLRAQWSTLQRRNRRAKQARERAERLSDELDVALWPW